MDRDALQQGLASLRLSLPDAAVERLLAYRDLLAKWNRAYNLTAVRDPQAMLARHLLDSLAALPYLPAGRVLDMGTGAGLPGIPFAIAQPERAVVLLDGNGKKTRFCRQACAELGLDNARVHQGRAEAITAAELGGGFDAVCARAFATLDAFWALAHPLLQPGGQALALKAAPEASELQALDAARIQWRMQALPSPDGARRRCLVVMESRTEQTSRDA